MAKFHEETGLNGGDEGEDEDDSEVGSVTQTG
jgi:hypothetical protein